MNIEIDRNPDWSLRPGKEALLTVGPLVFWVRTSDGIGFGFGFNGRGVMAMWSFERGPR